MANVRLPKGLVLGDARRLMDLMPAREPYVDLTITSPPYWDMKEYDKVEGQIGFGQKRQEYVTDVRGVLQACFEITKQTGALWLIADTFRRKGELDLLPFELGAIAKEVGWILRELVVWDKHYNLPWHQKGQMRNTAEYILFLTKSNDYKFFVDRIKTIDEISKWWVDFPERFNPRGKTPTNIWRFPTRRRGTWPNASTVNHLCPFPTGLVARIIELTSDPGDFVFDPFAGSGVVVAQALNMERSAAGIEINNTYIDMYRNEVIPTVKKEWVEIQKQRQVYSTAKDDFEKTIMKLRALKFSRQAVNAFVNTLEKDEISKLISAVSIVSLPEEFERDGNIDVELWFIGEKKHRFLQRGAKKAEERISTPPLTHFGINAEINVAKFSDFRDQNQDEGKKTYYLYEKARTRSYSKCENLNYWIDPEARSKLNTNGYFPFVSNIGVDVSWALD